MTSQAETQKEYWLHFLINKLSLSDLFMKQGMRSVRFEKPVCSTTESYSNGAAKKMDI